MKFTLPVSVTGEMEPALTYREALAFNKRRIAACRAQMMSAKIFSLLVDTKTSMFEWTRDEWEQVLTTLEARPSYREAMNKEFEKACQQPDFREFAAQIFSGAAKPSKLISIDAASVNNAYRELAKVVHPDVGGTTEQMQALNKFRAVLLGTK